LSYQCGLVDMEVIRDTIAQVMRGLEDKMQQNPQIDLWDLIKKILTKKELRHIKFRYFKKGVLGLDVDSSTWLYYLNAQRDDLLTRIGKYTDVIQDIRFYLGATK